MKQTKNFNIMVPELGDSPDITQVSNAIQSLEDALAGTLEVMNATIQGTELTLVSGARTTKRTGYYEGMAIKFVAPIQINENFLKTVAVDGLPAQPIEISYLVNAGDSADIIYTSNKFVGAITAIQRSNAIDSSSDVTVATSLAVKTLNDKKTDKATQVVAGKGLVGGGDLSTSRTINVANSNDSIIVNEDGIMVHIADTVSSTSQTIPASANATKSAYDKAVEGVNKANAAQSAADSKVSKSGDVMTGNLTLTTVTCTNVSGAMLGAQSLSGADKNIIYAKGSTVAFGNPSIGELNIDARTLGFKVDSSRYNIYHTGYKPSALDIGAKPRYRGLFVNRDVNESVWSSAPAMSGKAIVGGVDVNTGSSDGFLSFSSSTGMLHLFVDGDIWVGEGRRKVVSFEGNGSDLVVPGNIVAYSDIKFKENFEIIPDSIRKIKSLNGYTYTRRDTGEKQTGVVAQEVENVLPEAITYSKDHNGDDVLGVAYGNMVGLLIEGIKEQQKTIESLEDRLLKLEKLLEVK